MFHAETRVDRQPAIDAEVPLGGAISGANPKLPIIRRAQRARKMSIASQQSNALMLMKREVMLRVGRSVGIRPASPRANAFDRADAICRFGRSADILPRTRRNLS